MDEMYFVDGDEDEERHGTEPETRAVCTCQVMPWVSQLSDLFQQSRWAVA